MRIAVVGTGGVGGYFGGRLAQAGEDVVFLARGTHLRAILEHGLQVESADGDFTVCPAQATDDPAQIGPVDLVLLTVKGWQVPQAIETMRPLVGSESFVVPLLNGVEAPEQLAATFGTRCVLGGLCGLFGSVVGPGHIRNVFPRPFVTIGELDHVRSERCCEYPCCPLGEADVRWTLRRGGSGHPRTGGSVAQPGRDTQLAGRDYARGVRAGPCPWHMRSRRGSRESAGAHRPLARTGHRFHAAGHHGGSPFRTGVATGRGSAAGAPGGGRRTASHVSLRLPAPAGAQGARGDRVSHVRGALFNLFM